jgi:hypothetical protein
VGLSAGQQQMLCIAPLLRRLYVGTQGVVGGSGSAQEPVLLPLHRRGGSTRRAPVRPRLVLLDEVTACVEHNTADTIRQVRSIISSFCEFACLLLHAISRRDNNNSLCSPGDVGLLVLLLPCPVEVDDSSVFCRASRCPVQHLPSYLQPFIVCLTAPCLYSCRWLSRGCKASPSFRLLTA